MKKTLSLLAGLSLLFTTAIAQDEEMSSSYPMFTPYGAFYYDYDLDLESGADVTDSYLDTFDLGFVVDITENVSADFYMDGTVTDVTTGVESLFFYVTATVATPFGSLSFLDVGMDFGTYMPITLNTATQESNYQDAVYVNDAPYGALASFDFGLDLSLGFTAGDTNSEYPFALEAMYSMDEIAAFVGYDHATETIGAGVSYTTDPVTVVLGYNEVEDIVLIAEGIVGDAYYSLNSFDSFDTIDFWAGYFIGLGDISGANFEAGVTIADETAWYINPAYIVDVDGTVLDIGIGYYDTGDALLELETYWGF